MHKLSEPDIIQYLEALKRYGEEGLYRHAIGQSIMLSAKCPEIDVVVMDYADSFFVLYRRTGEEEYFTIGRTLRRAAHTLYRELLRQNKERKPNFDRFLNAVK